MAESYGWTGKILRVDLTTRDRQVVQVHRLRCLRGRLPVRRSVHRGLGCRHQRSTGCLHGPVRRNNNG